MNYQAKLSAPFGMLGIRCSKTALLGIDFLTANEHSQPPVSDLAVQVCVQLRAYLEHPDVQFSFPLDYVATVHRQKVWRALSAIPRGQTRSYGELARELHSSAQAVGQACGANPFPIVIPCHRVVSRAGLGGFMHHAAGDVLDIKRWLLAHESLTPSPLQGAGWGEGGNAESCLPGDENTQ